MKNVTAAEEPEAMDVAEGETGEMALEPGTDTTGLIVFGETKDAETGSANMVTSVVVNYRSFDTLGEVTVLFISALGVGLLLSGRRKRQQPAFEPSFILRQGARIVFGIMMVFGVYMFTHGHLTPGGGFPGGSIIAAAVLLLYVSDNEFQAKIKAFKVAEGLAGSLYVIAGLLGLALGGYFLQNFLPTGVVGNLLSAGVIPDRLHPDRSEGRQRAFRRDRGLCHRGGSGMIQYVSIAVMLTGVYGLLTQKNVIKLIVSLNIFEIGINVFIISVGYVAGGIAPILTSQNNTSALLYVDPLPQALVLTSIVIGVGVTALALAFARRLHKQYGTYNLDEMEGE